MARLAPIIAALSSGILGFLVLPAEAVPRTMQDPLPILRTWIERCSLSQWVPRFDSVPPVRRILERMGAPLIAMGMPLTIPGRSFLLILGCISSAFAGMVGARSMMGSLIGGGLFAVCVVWAGNASIRSSRNALKREMPQLIRVLAAALASGETLAQAIDYVGSRGTGEAAREFRRASLAIRCGIPIRDALDDLSARLDAPGTGLIVSALSISQRTGSPLESLLMRSAEMVEGSMELERQLEVKTAQARLSARTVCLLPVLMCAVLAMVSPDFQRGLTTLQGLVCVGAAVVLDALAILIIRRLMKGVLR